MADRSRANGLIPEGNRRSRFGLVESREPPEMPPIRTGWVPAKTLGELLRRTRACLGIENPTVFQPCLEIIGRCLDDHSRLETLRLYPLEYVHTKGRQ